MAIVAETCSPFTVTPMLMSEGKACAPALCLAQNTRCIDCAAGQTVRLLTARWSMLAGCVSRESGMLPSFTA